jgi:hypothetical protein
MTALHNNLYVFDGASIKGVLRLPDEPLYVQYGGTGATTAADARANLGITPANIGAAADSAAMQYRGWYPNGQSMLSLTPGYYRTSPNNLPSETFPSGIGYYGTLCVDNTGYTHITYIGVLGDFMIWKSNSPDRWYVVQRQGSVPVSSGGTGATTAAGARANLGLYHTKTITGVSVHSLSLGLSSCIILGAYLDGVGNTICLPYRASGGTWYMSFWTGINLSSYTPSNATLIVMYRDL